MKRLFSVLACPSVLGMTLLAQTASSDPHQWKMTSESTAVRISDHVWMIQGNPNIAIVVGTRAVLVVDTGMGPKMGALAAGFAQKLAPGKRLYLTTTHFHPEHAAGDAGFPSDTLLVRNQTQETEVERYGPDMVKMFASRSEENRALLADTTFRKADVTFHDEAKVDLGGGVDVRLLWLGPAHTEGDELTFVEPDATLVSGDVVQNATMPNIYTGLGKGGTPTTWLAVVKKLEALHAAHVVPDHSEPGDGSMVAAEAALIEQMRTRARMLKTQGKSADEAASEITAELKQEHPAWRSTEAKGFVQSVYADPDPSTP
jgi:glyoxylase-like metal-dependent hydrolase (beta-lactamase superfamily II)